MPALELDKGFAGRHQPGFVIIAVIFRHRRWIAAPGGDRPAWIGSHIAPPRLKVQKTREGLAVPPRRNEETERVKGWFWEEGEPDRQ